MQIISNSVKVAEWETAAHTVNRMFSLQYVYL